MTKEAKEGKKGGNQEVSVAMVEQWWNAGMVLVRMLERRTSAVYVL